MIDSDAFARRGGVLEASEDGASDASGGALEWPGAELPIAIRLPSKNGVLRTQRGAESPASESRAPGRSPLLDSAPSRLSQPLGSLADPSGAFDSGPFERRVPLEVFRVVWPVLDAYRGAVLDLFSLTLTSPDPSGISEVAADFARAVASDAGSGVLLARDVGKRAAHVHFHGLALTCEVPALQSLWSELAGVAARLTRANPVTGWKPLAAQDRERKFAKNLAGVLWYAFAPWPGEHGRYSLDSDVFASGPFAAPWRAARAALAVVGRPASEDAAEASAKRRTCERCGRSFPPRKRAHAIWCSPNCRKAASAASRATVSASKVALADDEKPGDIEPTSKRVHTPSGECT